MIGTVEATLAAPRSYWATVAVVAAAFLAAGFWNAGSVSPDLGYDAVQHQQYAHLLVEQHRIPALDPQTRALYDNPPGFYAVAGAAGKVGKRLGLVEDSAILYLNALFAVGAALLVLLVARELWPGRPVLQLGAFGFAALFPDVAKAAAMYNPASLALLFAAASIYVASRMLARRDYRLRWALALTALLLLGVLVDLKSLWVFAAVVLAFGWAFAAAHGDRRRLAAALGVVFAVSALAAAPWVARRVASDVPLLGTLPPVTAPWSLRPTKFFVELGLPDVLTRPFRPAYASILLPTAYSDLWGDYFGNYAWNAAVASHPGRAVHLVLATQSFVGLVPSALALAGWLALLALGVARPRMRAQQILLVLLPLLALGGFVYYASNQVTPDGDTIKGIFLLTATPAWALCFGFALDRLARGRAAAPLVVVLVLLALADLRFAFDGSPLGGLL